MRAWVYWLAFTALALLVVVLGLAAIIWGIPSLVAAILAYVLFMIVAFWPEIKVVIRDL